MEDLKDKTKKRCDELFLNLEMKFSCEGGGLYIGKSKLNSDFNVHWTEITCDTDEEWSKKIEDLKKELERRKNN